MRRVALLAVLVGAVVVRAQDQTTPKQQLSWKERAKLDYQKRYEKYILHRQNALSDEENTIAGGSGADSNAIPEIGVRGAPPPPPPPAVFRPPTTTTRRPPPTTTFRPPPPPSTTAFRPPPPPSTTTFRPPPPPSTTTFRPPPPPSTTQYRPPPPPPTTRAPRPPPPTTTTTPRPPPPPSRPAPPRRVVQTTEAPVVIGVRGGFPGTESAPAPAAPAVEQQGQQGQQDQQGQQGQQGQQSTVSGTFQSRPGAFPASPSGGGFASSSATAFNSGGVSGGSSGSSAGTYNAGGVATGTFSFTTGGSSSASGSSTGAVSKSPVALLGKVVQGIVRPITSILPAPLGPKGSNPGLVGGLVSGIFEELDGGLRAIYPGNKAAVRRNARSRTTSGRSAQRVAPAQRAQRRRRAAARSMRMRAE